MMLYDKRLELDFRQFEFGSVLDLPAGPLEVYDFTAGYDPQRQRSSVYGIGRYNEKRLGMYTSELFNDGASSADNIRNIHVGIDLAAPVGSPVRAFFRGRIYLAAINGAVGDYGGTIITEHDLGRQRLWALYGHLSHASVRSAVIGKGIEKGEKIGCIGDLTENGGWNPHLHFQLSLVKPLQCDLPGAVSQNDLEEALKKYPDPRLVLGPLY